MVHFFVGPILIGTYILLLFMLKQWFENRETSRQYEQSLRGGD